LRGEAGTLPGGQVNDSEGFAALIEEGRPHGAAESPGERGARERRCAHGEVVGERGFGRAGERLEFEGEGGFVAEEWDGGERGGAFAPEEAAAIADSMHRRQVRPEA